MLESRLYELELRKIEEIRIKTSEAKKDIGWGNQIRSYVMQPYKLVKDLRTGEENTNIEIITHMKMMELQSNQPIKI